MVSLMISLRSKGYFRAGRAALEFWPELPKPTRMAMTSTSAKTKDGVLLRSSGIVSTRSWKRAWNPRCWVFNRGHGCIINVYQCIDLEHNFYIFQHIIDAIHIEVLLNSINCMSILNILRPSNKDLVLWTQKARDIRNQHQQDGLHLALGKTCS